MDFKRNELDSRVQTFLQRNRPPLDFAFPIRDEVRRQPAELKLRLLLQAAAGILDHVKH